MITAYAFHSNAGIDFFGEFAVFDYAHDFAGMLGQTLAATGGLYTTGKCAESEGVVEGYLNFVQRRIQT